MDDHGTPHNAQGATLERRPPSVRQLHALERRLDDGFQRIEVAQSAGKDTLAWEEFWLHLLEQYESLADDLAAAA